MTPSKVPLFAGLDAVSTQPSTRKPVDLGLVDELARANDFPSRPVATGVLPDTGKPPAGGKLPAKDAFPLHVDTAHWPVPCRYVVMACASAGGQAASTSLLPIDRLTLTRDEQSMLHSTVFRVRCGRHSFFGTVASRERSFIRFDPGCMEPTCSNGSHIMSLLSSERWASSVDALAWEPGVIVVVDNWRVLHGRDVAAGIESESRTLLRVLVQ